MGDGTIDDRNDPRRNPRLRVIMTNKKFLEFLHEKLQPLVTKEPYINRTAEEAASMDRENSFSMSDDPSNYKDLYKIQTMSHPNLEQFADWYKTGEKVWPETIELSPTVLKYWYVSDGSFNNNAHRSYVSIHCTNERENKKKVEKMFTDVGLRPCRWRDEKKNDGSYKTAIVFNKTETDELFDYMGDCPPGFEYKWK